ncbi:hypothetical protein E3O44_10845 [Cryobacterium algoricola]|uniref:Uncharacterized protein n=1 Tax=Cryobacterium algoricola TaxID=1259183 RepID=A0ABY2IFC6_9MICO|nr:hypothetical protein [Cryobacterium algoricola]TFB87581.1 hypothetical protein E3O44_10845 [Cryobacterium algoricola]
MTTELEAWVLAEGLDDWVPLDSIEGRARFLYPTADNAEIERTVVSAASSLIGQGLVDAGSVREHVGFATWDGPPESWPERIRAEVQFGEIERWGWIWLRLTPRGFEVAAASLAK